MRNQFVVAAVLASVTLSGCATSYTMTPHPGAAQSVRYFQGQPTIYAQGEHGAVQVTPYAPNENGRLTYSVAAFNNTAAPVNFGAEDMSLMADGAPVRIFTYPELERMAKNDATTLLVLTAIAGGASAAAAASGPTSRSTTYTPYGTYQTVTTNYAAQAVASSVAAAATSAQMRDISNQLDATLGALGQNILQTTTIDPKSTFGGQIVGDRVVIPEEGELSTSLTIRFAGEEYVVNFGISRQQ